MSIASLFMQEVVWRLTSLDYPGLIIEGQYHPTDLTENISANYAQLGTLGREQPILQYQNGDIHSVTFGAKVFAHHQGILGTGLNGDNIDDLVFQIRRLPQPDVDLKRPQIWDFTIGDTDNLIMTCVVKSVGGIRYDRLRPSDGSLRGAQFTIELWRYDPFSADLTGSQNESLVVPRRSNESFEFIAKKIYGDALIGEPLRRRHPDKVVPKNGDLIRVPPKSALTVGFVLEPESVSLKPSDATDDVRRKFFDLRGGSYKSHILGADWEGA